MKTTDAFLVIVLGAVLCFQGSGALTNDELSKFGVSGNYAASVSVDQSNSEYYTISASGIPDHAWQQVNPNTPTNQNYNVKVPKTPKITTTKACVPFGKIGLTRTGVAIYNPLAAGSVNAVEGASKETFDSCDGHASPDGAYHYHKIPDSCLYQNTVDEFIGVAFDGFPIYGPNVSDIPGRWLTSDDLDSCHGRTVNGQYRYHVTTTFPYFLGCYHGEVYSETVTVTYTCDLSSNSWANDWTHYLCECPAMGGGGPGGGPPPPGGGPPPPPGGSTNTNNNGGSGAFSAHSFAVALYLLLSSIAYALI